MQVSSIFRRQITTGLLCIPHRISLRHQPKQIYIRIKSSWQNRKIWKLLASLDIYDMSKKIFEQTRNNGHKNCRQGNLITVRTQRPDIGNLNATRNKPWEFFYSLQSLFLKIPMHPFLLSVNYKPFSPHSTWGHYPPSHCYNCEFVTCPFLHPLPPIPIHLEPNLN